MRLRNLKSGKSYVDKLVALKSLVLSLSNISPKFLLDQNRFLSDQSLTFLQCLITCFVIAVRQEVNKDLRQS